jgi:hypothetical protein
MRRFLDSPGLLTVEILTAEIVSPVVLDEMESVSVLLSDSGDRKFNCISEISTIFRNKPLVQVPFFLAGHGQPRLHA